MQMLAGLFSQNSFIPHGHCYLWKPELVGLHVVSDLVTAFAYYSIPLILIDFVRRRRDIPYPWVFLLFSAFIIACGTTHLMDIWTLWYPTYWLSGVIKAVTAIVSFTTVLLLVPMVPKALALASPAKLELANYRLQQEIDEHQKTGAALHKARDELELRVAERTVELLSTCEQLRASEEKFRQLAENIRKVFFILSIDLQQVIYVSPAYEQIWGRSCDSFYQDANSWLEAVHPDDREKVLAGLRQQDYGEPVHQEYQILHPDGSIRWVSCRTFSVCNDAGEFYRIAGIAEDITDRKQAEEELRQAEHIRLELRLLENILEIILAGYWDWDIPGDREYLSPTFKRMFGYEDHELPNIPQTWQQLIFAEDLSKVFECFEQHVKSGGQIPYYNEVRYRHKDGSTVWVICSGRVIEWDLAGKPLRMIGCHIDITDRKLAEQTLQENEQFLRSIYDGVEQAIFVVDVLENGEFRFVGVNPAHEHLTGLGTADLQGKTPEEALPPGMATTMRQQYQACLETGEGLAYEEYLPFKEGAHWWFTSLTPLYDAQGRVYRIVGNSINISDRKQAEQQLELQDIIVRNMAEGICLVRASDGTIVYTNPRFEHMFGYDVGELIGNPVSIVNYSDDTIDADAVARDIHCNVEACGEYSYEVYNVKKDGTPFWCRATTARFDHPDFGTVYVAVQADITNLKQAEAEARKALQIKATLEKKEAALKEKDVLLQEIHHRVKNNLQIIDGLLHMQYRRTENPQASAILLESQHRVKSIALVHEKLYRSEDLANIDFADYLRSLVSSLVDSYQIGTNNVEIDLQIDKIGLSIDTAIPCGLIVNELVSNALKYAFPNSRIGKIRLAFHARSSEQCQLIVQDNGVGIPDHIDWQKTRSLGLKLVRGLASQLAGTVVIQRQQGTLVTISFPITCSEAR